MDIKEFRDEMEERAMAQSTGIPEQDLKTLVERLGLDLSAKDMEAVKAMYDHYAPGVARLNEQDLGEEDLAVLFPPEGSSGH